MKTHSPYRLLLYTLIIIIMFLTGCSQSVLLTEDIERSSQESSSKFLVAFYYQDRSSDKIWSTETGEVIFRRLSGNGWVGGRNTGLLKLVKQADNVPDINFEVYLVREIPAKTTDIELNQLKLEGRPILTEADRAHVWDGTRLKIKQDILIEKLRGKVPTSGKPFVLIIDDRPAFWGRFWTALSSLYSPSGGPVIYYDIPERNNELILFQR